MKRNKRSENQQLTKTNVELYKTVKLSLIWLDWKALDNSTSKIESIGTKLPEIMQKRKGLTAHFNLDNSETRL